MKKVKEHNARLLHHINLITAGINDQEIANGIGIDPKFLVEKGYAGHRETKLGPTFRGWYSVNWRLPPH